MNTKDVLNSDFAKYAVLAVAGLAVLWYLKNKISDAADGAVDAAKKSADYLKKDGFNVTSSKNIANTTATTVFDAVVGQGEFSNAWDHLFAGIDLLNPFNDSDTYAKQVWGIGQNASSVADHKTIQNDLSEDIYQ